ncbi:MAG: hypothetical protein BWY15_02287 [Firmicutes bacterium ADurb.Bin193]|nr:MAG: hypothetical protein BWY15_02287 [Firmicutes bacterium ADurb.Bin193]
MFRISSSTHTTRKEQTIKKNKLLQTPLTEIAVRGVFYFCNPKERVCCTMKKLTKNKPDGIIQVEFEMFEKK